MSIGDRAREAASCVREKAEDLVHSETAKKVKDKGAQAAKGAKKHGTKLAEAIGDTTGVLAFALLMKPAARLTRWWRVQKEDFELYRQDDEE